MGRNIKAAGHLVKGDRIWIDNDDFTGWDTIVEIQNKGVREFHVVTEHGQRRLTSSVPVEVMN